MRKGKHKICQRCLIDRQARWFRADATTGSGLAAWCVDCQDGRPIPAGLEQRRKLRQAKFARQTRARKLAAAGVEPEPVAPALSDAAANDQARYCAFLYEAARERVRKGRIAADDPEYRDALKAMEFLTKEQGMVRANGIVYVWDRGADVLDRRVDVSPIADARDYRPQDTAGIRVFREPRFRPQRGVPMRSVYA